MRYCFLHLKAWVSLTNIKYCIYIQIGMLLDPKTYFNLLFLSLSLTDMSAIGNNLFRPNTSFTTSENNIFFCYLTYPFHYIYITYSITSLFLVLPVLILVLHLGVQQWRELHSAKGTTNSDVFTFHLAITEVIGIFGSIVACIGIFKWDLNLLICGIWFFNLTWYSETYFHLLACIECYLAVVYPIRYQSLRRKCGITIRNVSLLCVWLLSFGGIAMMMVNEVFAIMDICVCILSFIITFYCGLCVLHILGKKEREKSGNKDRVCQTRIKAYYIFFAMLAVLLFRFTLGITWSCFNISVENICQTIIFESWLSLPGRLMLPIHFLHRSGIFSCSKHSDK